MKKVKAFSNIRPMSEEQIKNLPKTDLVEKVLSEYIGRKVMALEIKR